MKDQISFELRLKVVYTIGCRTCNAFYIGKPSRCLKVRMEEHRKSSESHVYQHSVDNKHKIDLENVRILDKDSNQQKLLLREMLKHKPTMNIQKHSYVFSMFIGKNITDK